MAALWLAAASGAPACRHGLLRSRHSSVAVPGLPTSLQQASLLAAAHGRRRLSSAAAAACAVAAAAISSSSGQLPAQQQQQQQQQPEQQQQQQQQQPEAFPELVLQLPPPSNSQVKSASFVKSSVRVEDCPPPRHPEFAVIGRSNVGKSSLINMLTGRKALAMVSKEPGKTRCINHFLINSSWYLVDLPGYGYARTGKAARADFAAFSRAYLTQRPSLVMVLLLVDASIPPQALDLEYAAWLAGAGVPFSLVFTKADKRKKGGPRAGDNVAAFKRSLLQAHGFGAVPPSLVTSASTGLGKQELLGFVASLRVLYEQTAGQGGGKAAQQQGQGKQQQQRARQDDGGDGEE